MRRGKFVEFHYMLPLFIRDNCIIVQKFMCLENEGKDLLGFNWSHHWHYSCPWQDSWSWHWCEIMGFYVVSCFMRAVVTLSFLKGPCNWHDMWETISIYSTQSFFVQQAVTWSYHVSKVRATVLYIVYSVWCVTLVPHALPYDWSQLHPSNQRCWRVVNHAWLQKFVNELAPPILQTFWHEPTVC